MDLKMLKEDYDKQKIFEIKLRSKAEKLQDERVGLREKCILLQEQYDNLVSIQQTEQSLKGIIE